MATKNYVGNKGGTGIKEQLFNVLPKADNYFSFFLGGAGFESLPEFSSVVWQCSELNPDLQSNLSTTAVVVCSNYKDLAVIKNYSSADCIFADPPYIFETRLSGRRYYKHEFEMKDHIEFLKIITSLNARVIITHPYHIIYKALLKGWYFRELNYQTRAGWFFDGIWTNFAPESVELFNYNCLGTCRTERQAIKRKRNNFLRKLRDLPYHEQMAIFKQLNAS